MAGPTLDPVPQSSQSDGRWKIAYVPKGSNPLSAAILKGATAKQLTYSFTPDGFPWTSSQATVSDPRLTLMQILSRPGKITEDLTLKYVDSIDPDSAAALLTDNLEGFFVIRRGKANETEWAVGDIVYVITFMVGVQNPDQPVENGVDTISQPVTFVAPTQRKVPVVA